MKVIIIGAGVAGLTMALACEQAGFEVKLYDKAKALRHIGGGLLLWPHAVRFLEWLQLADCLRSYYVPIKGCRLIGLAGREILKDDYAAFYSLLGGEILPIDRSIFQQVLLGQLTPSVLELDKRCIRIDTSTHEASVYFSDGTVDSADIIIGADGLHSMVRQTLCQSELKYTNNCWWGGIIERKHVPSLAANEVFIAMGIGKTCIAWPTHNDRLMWYLPVKMPAEELTPEGISQLRTLCAGWSDEVEQIIRAPSTGQRFHFPIYTMAPQTDFSSSRVTLIGDAAHALGPILGQGANQAVEDAFVLITSLCNSPTIPAALKRYESLRFERSLRLFELENHSSSVMITDDVQTLEAFQEQLQHVTLANIYQDLIPLLDRNACQALALAAAS